MKPKKSAIHVNPMGKNWEVETETSTLGQAETKPEAIAWAEELGPDVRARKIKVHSADGSVEAEIDVQS